MFLLILFFHLRAEYKSTLPLFFGFLLVLLIYTNLINGTDPDIMLVYYIQKCKILIQNFSSLLYYRVVLYPAYNFHMSPNMYVFILALISINYILLYIIYMLLNNIVVKASPYTGLFLSIFISSLLLLISNFLFG